MTDRHAGYLITLADDVREDDAETIITALRMVRGVQSVDPVPADPRTFITASRRDIEWSHRLVEVIEAMRRS